MPTRYGPALLCCIVLAGLVFMSVKADDQRISRVVDKTTAMQQDRLDLLEAKMDRLAEDVKFLREHVETLMDITK